MSKKEAKYVQYEGALYRLKEGGGLGTTRHETNVSLFTEDFDSEGELQYSGTPEGGQFFFESRIKFPDGSMLPVSLPIDEESAAQIVTKLVGPSGMEQFPDKWRSLLPAKFIERIEHGLQLPEEESQKALPAPRVEASTAAKTVTATIYSWRKDPKFTVAQIQLKLGAAGAAAHLERVARRAQRVLIAQYPNARVSVSIDGKDRTDNAYLRVIDHQGQDTSEHDHSIMAVITRLFQQQAR